MDKQWYRDNSAADVFFLKFTLNIFAGNSALQTTQYERLAQDPSDNEEEDDILFRREGQVLTKQNGHPKQNGMPNEDIEMNNVNGTTSTSDIPTAEELNIVKFKVVKRANQLWRTRVSCFVLLLILVLLLGLTLAFIVPYFHTKKILVTHHLTTKGWNKTLDDLGKIFLSFVTLKVIRVIM